MNKNTVYLVLILLALVLFSGYADGITGLASLRCVDKDRLDTSRKTCIKLAGKGTWCDRCADAKTVSEVRCISGNRRDRKNIACAEGYECVDGVCVQRLPSECIGANCLCKQFINNGDPKRMINFVFIADHFVDESYFKVEFGKLVNTKDKLSFINYPPFVDFNKYFNIFTYYNKSLDLGCDSDWSSGTLCYSGGKLFEKIKEDCNGLELDHLIIVSSLSGQLSSGTQHRVIVVDENGISRLKKLGFVKHFYLYESAYSKQIFLHELMHAFGLTDEYILAGSRYPFYYKPYTQLTDVLGNPSFMNLDIIGCPKWCSGEIDKTSEFYQRYDRYLQCTSQLVSPDTMVNGSFYHGDDDKYYNCFKNTLADVMPPSLSPSIKIQPLWYNNIGVGCMEGTGCYWGANYVNLFKSTPDSLMSHEMYGEYPTLGPYNEELLTGVIQNVLKQKGAILYA